MPQEERREENKHLNKSSKIPTGNNNINFLGLWAESMYFGAFPLAWWEMSHCFDEKTRLPQSLLHSASPTALDTHWVVLCLCWGRTEGYRLAALFPPGVGWGLRLVLRTGSKADSGVGLLAWTTALGGWDTQVWSWLTKGLGSTGWLFIVVQPWDLDVHSR